MSVNWAVKYRPTNFEDVVGQTVVVQVLKKVAEERRIPSILLCGKSGVGKTTLLRLYGKAVLGGRTGMDLLEVDAAASGNVEEVRKLSKWCSIMPQEGEFKVLIIDEIHALTREAGTVLLSMVEEPNSFVRFGFATTNPSKVLPTIISRSMVFPLRPIEHTVIVDRMKGIAKSEGIDVPERAYAEIARFSGGQLRNAIRLLQQASYLDSEEEWNVRALVGLPSEVYEHEFLTAVFNLDSERLFEYCNIVYEQGVDVAVFVKSLIVYLDGVVADRFKEGLIDEQTGRMCFWVDNLITLYREVETYPAVGPSALRAWCAKILNIL